MGVEIIKKKICLGFSLAVLISVFRMKHNLTLKQSVAPLISKRTCSVL